MKVNRHSLFLILITITLLSLNGCFSSRPEDIQAFQYPNQTYVTMDEYILQPPDEVTLISTKIPLLTGSTTKPGLTQVIKPDGTISLEDVGQIPVAGKTPRQVAEIIAQKLSTLYKLAGDYPVDVQIVNNSKFIYVVGQVERAGPQPYTGRDTVLSVIARAIPNTLAWEEKIQVIRPAKDPAERSMVFGLDFKQMAEHGKMDQNILLQDGDVIYVPPTILASIGLTVGEIVSPILSAGSAATVFAAP
jgi:protein involved in polysaccharide export with SLBB domain